MALVVEAIATAIANREKADANMIRYVGSGVAQLSAMDRFKGFQIHTSIQHIRIGAACLSGGS